MGSRFTCEKVTGKVSETSVAVWEDTEKTYCLRQTTEKESLCDENNAFEDLIHQAGTSSAVWAIGTNVICKVKTWCEGMELESDTLAFLAGHFPHIPISEVIYSWLDRKLDRTFLILKRVEGQTLQDAWPSLSSKQRHQVAATIAHYCHNLAILTSMSLQSSTGLGVLEPFLNVQAESSHPSWKPRPLGPLPLPVFQNYLQKISKQSAPLVGETFHFYHADLGPTNILVSNDGKVRGVLDWESAGFYPKFWIALKPYISAGFLLNTSTDYRYEWVDLLESELSGIDLELDMKDVDWHKSLDLQYFDVRQLLDDN
jgi:hypothetical protein